MNKVRCNGERFKALRNPYTGEPVDTYMVVLPDGAVRFTSDTYSPASPVPTLREAFLAWDRVDGVGGLRADGGVPRCAWTGATLTPVSSGASAWYDGGFNPAMLHTREDYFRAMESRGVMPDPEPEPPRVERPAPVVHTKRQSTPVEPSDESLKLVGDAFEKTRSATGAVRVAPVSMHVSKKRK